MKRPIIFLCSPYAARDGRSISDHYQHARQVSKTIYACRGIPWTPQVFFHDILDDNNPTERQNGLIISRRMVAQADALFVDTMGGAVSSGMEGDIEVANAVRIPVYRFEYDASVDYVPNYELQITRFINAMKGR